MYITRKASPTQEAFRNMLLNSPYLMEKKVLESALLGLLFVDIYLQEYVKKILSKNFTVPNLQ